MSHVLFGKDQYISYNRDQPEELPILAYCKTRKNQADYIVSKIIEFQKTQQKGTIAVLARVNSNLNIIGKTLEDKKVAFLDSSIPSEDRICLTTVHSAKGKGYDFVIMINVDDNTYPYHLDDDKDLIEESRRLFAMGLSRAKKKLLITYYPKKNQKKRKQHNFCTVSRYLNCLMNEDNLFKLRMVTKKGNKYYEKGF